MSRAVRAARILSATVLGLAVALPAAPAAGAPLASPDPGDGPVGGPNMGSARIVAAAGAPALPAGINARSWLVADLDTGDVLASRDPHHKYLPASTLKTLTALTLLPELTNRRQVVKATAEEANIDGTRVGLVPNGRYTVEMLFQCMLMMSGNDCATLLARTAPGGVPATLAKMNAEAQRIGAFDTHAATPSGLDGPRQSSSAYDLALIMRAALEIPDFHKYNTTLRSVVPAQPPKYGAYQFSNDNRLLHNYPGVLAAKNGYTDAARHTFMAAAQRGKRRLVVTLMNGERQPVDMWRQSAALLDWGFALKPDVTPVGELVGPQSDDGPQSSSTARAKPSQSPQGASVAGGDGESGGRWWPPALGAAALFVVAAGTAVTLRRLRPRRL